MGNYGSFSHSLSNYAALKIFSCSKVSAFYFCLMNEMQKACPIRDIGYQLLTLQFSPLGDCEFKFELLIDSNPC